MKMHRKQWLGTVASAAIALTAVSGGISYAKGKSDTIKVPPPEVARGKSDTIKPNPPTAADWETGQLLIRTKPIANPGGTPADTTATENDLCGVPYTPPCSSVARNKSDTIKPNAPKAVDYETGQLLIKDRPK